jgi:hypothetical protein
MRRLIILVILGWSVEPALAEDERVRPVANPTVKEECGACHMAFQPQFLPQRSWRKLMSGLSDHFGEDASLGEATRQEIENYLLANAGDTSRSGAGRWMTRSIPADQTPLRITEVPAWIREHRGEVRESAWSSPRVASKANCQACHRGAAVGYYDDD